MPSSRVLVDINFLSLEMSHKTVLLSSEERTTSASQFRRRSALGRLPLKSICEDAQSCKRDTCGSTGSDLGRRLKSSLNNWEG